MRPRILLNSPLGDRPTSRSHLFYCDAIAAAGGLPLTLAPSTDPALLQEALSVTDGVLFVGSPDYHPEAYGGRAQPVEQLMDRRRHDGDLLLAQLVLERRLPVLGVCGGLQLILIARGGGLVQDLPTDWPGALTHTTAQDTPATRHGLTTVAGTRLHELIGPTCEVNSYHHQAAHPEHMAGLTIAAHAPDGVIEALEDPVHPFLLGVQWHPERMADSASSRALFGAMVEAARLHAAR